MRVGALFDVADGLLAAGDEAVVAVPDLGALLGARGHAAVVDALVAELADDEVLLEEKKKW